MSINVLFVCAGNICRSPLAEGIFRHYCEKAHLSSLFKIDSAGTGAWHVGEKPDSRSTKIAAQHGIKLKGRSRQFQLNDFKEFDHILVMDNSNYRDILNLCDPIDKKKVKMMRNFEGSEFKGLDVPDPYYGGGDGFEVIYGMLDKSCKNLFEKIKPKSKSK